ncbi:hypothetical protein [Cecembia sp.]|uniref:hypothetical protein n=1 Tax=Cecembia sp. TaxID=1898110 RepID=UPI0025B9E601|nr:hypothetical protein [Cecembia sp.]
MTNIILILWAILLAVTVLLLPFIVRLLHSTWEASRNIERYFKEMKEAGIGISENTGYVSELDNTISVASGILKVAGEIDNNAKTIKEAVSERALKQN